MRKGSIKFRTKLFVTYLLLVSFPLFILGYLSYQQYVHSIEKNVGEYVPAILKQANDNIDKYMADLVATPDVITRSNDIVSILRKKQPDKTSAMEQDAFTVQSFLASNIVNGRHHDVIAVFIQSGNRLYASSRLKYEGNAFTQEKLPFGQELDLRGKPLFVPPDRQKLVFENDQPYISIYKQLYDADNMKTLCTVLLIVDLSEISKICEEIPFATDGMLFITNEIGQTVYHNNKNLIGKSTLETSQLPLNNGTAVVELNHERMLVSAKKSDYTEWTLAAVNPINALTKETVSIRNFTITIFFVCLVMAVVLSAFISQKVTTPIRSLQALMRKVEKGDFKVSFPIHQSDEIGQLGNSFNHMVKRIQELVEQVYHVELRQREAELTALQNQISPHFLYNTLESIQMVTELGDSERASDMISALSRMLRFAARRGDVILISDEVRHVSDYLYIQQIRYGNRCDYRIELKTDISNLYGPKFILQPLVENAIRHAVEKTNSPTRIYIKIEQIEQGIRLAIEDNGPGISPDTLRKIQERLGASIQDVQNGGIGLVNVHSRIRLLYGEDYGISIQSQEMKGTQISVLIPFVFESRT